MIENLTDKEIIQGMRHYDEKVTREFFYDTCLMAYSIDNKKYGLRYKTGMDFYSLAHEYYLRLCNKNWQQLEKCKPGYTLAKWTMNGFHFLVRERLKSYADGFFEESIEERASRGKVAFDAPVDNTDSEVKEMVEEICHAYYGDDRTSQSILRMILIMGMKGKEVAAMIGITPSAVSQRYRSMFDNVVRPYFLKYYRPEIAYSISEEASFSMDMVPEPKRANMYMEEEIIRRKLEETQMQKEQRLRLNTEDANAAGDTTKKSLWDRIRFWRHEASEAETVSRITPPLVKTLRDNEVFVFGSDLRGVHCGGTAYQALRSFGAVLGQGAGPQGKCYAIPTIVGGVQNIKPYVDDFIRYAISHPGKTFLVTKVGCGIAGFTPQDMAPLFAAAKTVKNICLPQEFWEMM